MVRLPWSLLLVLAVSPALVVADEFRVTGVFGMDARNLAALVETGDGSYRTLRAGDELAGLRVIEVTRKGIRVDRDGNEAFVGLNEGDLQLRADAAGEHLAPTNLANRLRASAQIREQGGLQGLEDLARQPIDTRVVRVNDKADLSEDDAVGTIEGTLGKGERVRLELDGATSTPILYLSPAEVVEESSPARPSEAHR